MKKLTWTLLALSTLALVVFFLVFPSEKEGGLGTDSSRVPKQEGKQENDGTRATPQSPQPQSVVADPVREEIAPPSPKTLAGAQVATTGLRGRVIDSQGRPLEGVVVSYFERGVSFEDLDVEVVRSENLKPAKTAKSDAAGKFSFSDLAVPAEKKPGQTMSCRIEASLDGYVAQGTRFESLVVGSVRELVPVTLYRESKIFGRLESPGALLRSANVRAQREFAGEIGLSLNAIPGQVGEDGRFEITRLSPGKWHVLAGAKGMRAAESEVLEIAEGETKSGIVLSLLEGLTIQGRVTGPQGQPIVGAEILVTRIFKSFQEIGSHVGPSGMGSREPILTDAQGHYAVDGLEPGEYAIRVKAKGFAEASRSQIEAGASDVNFQMGDRGWIVGKVQNLTGEPVSHCAVAARRVRAGAGVEFVNMANRNKPLASTKSDAEGSFRIEGLEPGQYALDFELTGFAPKSVDSVTVYGGRESALGNISLGQGATFRLRILDGGPDRGLADASAEMENVPEETSPSPGFRTRAVMIGGPTSEGAKKQRRSDRNGFIVFENLPAGRYEVRASHPDRASAKDEIVLAEGEEKELSLTLGKGGSLCGVVFAASGEIYPSASVRLQGEGQPRFDTIADAEGKYCFRHVAPGRYWAQLREGGPGFEGDFAFTIDDGEKPEGQEVILAEGQDLLLDLRDIARGELTGVVRQGETAIEGVRVAIAQGEEPAPFAMLGAGEGSQLSNAQGAYRIERIKPGKYTVSAARPGSALPVKASFEIQPGVNHLDLEIPGGVIEGVVRDAATGKPVAGARVNAEEQKSGTRRQTFAISISMDGNGGGVMTSDGSVDPARTDEEGKFRLRDMPAGKFRLRVKDTPGYAEGEIENIELGKDEHKKGVEISLEKGGTVRGKLLDNAGNPVSFGFLFLTKEGAKGPPKISGTGPDGGFRFDGVSAGKYTLRSGGAQGDKAAEAEIFVKPGQTVEKELRLPAK